MFNKKNFFPIFTLLVITFSQCSTTRQQRAEQVAFADACPKYGFFSKDEIYSNLTGKPYVYIPDPEVKCSSILGEIFNFGCTTTYTDQKWIAIKKHDGKITHRPKNSLYSASLANTKNLHDSFKMDYEEICGNDSNKFGLTNYEQLNQSKKKVEDIKNSSKWKKALSQSAEFDLGEKGNQILLAFLNSKDNDILNNIYYKGNPSEETEDRKIWKAIQKSKYIYIQKDNSEKYTYFYSKDYDVKSQTFPVYYEQGVSFGRSGMIQGDGLYIPRILSETIPIKLSNELATKIGKKEIVYNLDVIFTYTTENSNHSYYYANDNGLEIVLNEEKANLVRRADPFTFRSLSKRSGKGKTIKLKPLYYIFSIPEEDVLITNVK